MCIRDSSCSVGSDNEFSGNISLKGGTAYKSTFDASGITADRTLTIPNNTGTLALTSDIPSSSYTPDAPFLKADATGAATSGTATADAPFVSVDASGQLDSSATLTASTPLKSDANSQIVAADLVPEDDLTVGSGTAGQVLAVNSGGTALEFISAGGGGQWSLVASGHSMEPTTAIDGGTASHDVLICWGGASSTDGTDGSYFRMTNGKQYKLVVETLKSPYVNLHNTSGYNGHGFGYLSDGYDCGNGTTCTNCSGSNGYANTLPSWYYHLSLIHISEPTRPY